MKAFDIQLEESDYYKHWRFKVHGFWSRSTVSVYQFRKMDENEVWVEPTLNWSCGGRDYEEEPSDSQAARNFASAMLKAAQILDEIKEAK
jgi:hypothetical protein